MGVSNHARAVWLACAVSLCVSARARAQSSIKSALRCDRGDSDQTLTGVITMPETVSHGAVFQVRIDSAPSGRISHVGLEFLHDLSTEYRLPEGALYIEGSAHFIPGSGSDNASRGARVERQGRALRVVLPGPVENGASYLPPSLQFSLRADALPGTALQFEFIRYQLGVRVFLLGDLLTTCLPAASPAVLATTLVEAGAQP